MKIHRPIFLLLLSAAAGCPLFLHAQRIVFTPQWTPQSQFAGYYVAQALGFYRDAGLEVTISHPSASNPSLNRLREGSCDVTTLQLVQAIENIDKGFPLVNILQTSQRNSLLIVPRRDDIRTLQDLRGKKVGIWKAGFGELARMLDHDQNLQIEWIPFVTHVNLFVSGAIDATLAMSYNEYLQIRVCGINPARVFYLSELGYDIPEDGLYVTAAYYKRNREMLQRFTEASKRGWQWVAQHPQEALDIVMKYVRQAHASTNRLLQERMLENILELQRDRGSDSASFELHPKHVERASALLFEHGRIGRKITFREISGDL